MVTEHHIQIAGFLAERKLPHQLELLLCHPRILKAGRLVGADLAHLQSACGSSIAFSGSLDLAKYAKDRRVIPNAQCSLSDLCALILGKRLNKNVPERISQAWEDRTLTRDQQNYAARDAYVALILYETLSKLNAPHPLPPNFDPMTPVLLYGADNTTVIAQGHISQHFKDKYYDGINITPSRTVLDVINVYIPGALVTTHRKQALNSFGPAPFSIVCLKSHIRVFNPTTYQIPPPTKQLPIILPSNAAKLEKDAELQDSDATIPGDDNGMIALGDLLRGNNSGSSKDFSIPQPVDSASAALGAKILGPDPVVRSDVQSDFAIRSRVLKDPFHIFNMFYISATHPLRVRFMQELCDALFIPDQADKDRINAWGATQNPCQTYEQLRNRDSLWVSQRCKHIIPSPEKLYPLVSRVFRTYGPMIDPISKKPLFSLDNWKTAKNVLDLVRNGFVSDPPGIAIYTVIGLDKKNGGLPRYRCSRGTNATEGGVHKHIRERLPKCGTSLRHMQATLYDFVLHHNLHVSDNFVPVKPI